MKNKSNKCTIEKYKFGVDNEYYFIVLMRMYKLDLENFNDEHQYSPVDFRTKTLIFILNQKHDGLIHLIIMTQFLINWSVISGVKNGHQQIYIYVYICFYFETDKK